MSFVIFSCKENEPAPYHEEELITSVELQFTQVDNPENQFVISYKDIDGDGGNNPVQNTPIKLLKNTSYKVEVKVKDESGSIANDLTEEVKEEGVNHQFFFSFNPFGLGTHNYLDKDVAEKPIGLSNTITANQEGSGTLTVTLRHEPNKEAEGVSAGNISTAGGETDIEAIFTIVVE